MSDDARPTTPAPIPDSPTALPDDLVILRQMVVELLAALRERQRENQQLQHRLDLLLRRLYGARTERVDPNQLLLIPDALDAAAPPEPASPPDSAAEKKKSRPHGRRPLPKDCRASNGSTS
jgi:transposase